MPVAAIAAASAAASIGGGIAKGVAASDAAKAAAEATAQNNALADKIYGSTKANFDPFITTGQNASGELGALLGLGGNSQAAQDAFNKYLASTNYNFQLNQGLKGIEYANAPAFSSGATAKALNNYAQGQAGSALGGYEQMLFGLSGQGIQSAGALGQIGTNYVAQESSNNNNLAGIRGQTDLMEGNAAAGALSGMASSFSMGMGGLGSLSSFGGGGGGGALPGGALEMNPATGAMGH